MHERSTVTMAGACIGSSRIHQFSTQKRVHLPEVASLASVDSPRETKTCM